MPRPMKFKDSLTGLAGQTSSRHQQSAEAIQRTMDQIKALRATMPEISLPEILAARHEGHRYG